MARLPLSLAIALAFLFGADRAGAQDTTGDAPAHISFVEGTVILERDGQADREPGPMPLLAGDRLRTENGRAEVLFGDGSALHLDLHTTIDFQSDEVVRLLDGRIRLSIAGPAREVAYRIDAPSAWVYIGEPGEYRVSLLRSRGEIDVELAVLRGSAELANEAGQTPLRAGERAFARADAAPSYAYVFNSAAWDAFDRWSEARRDQRMGVSAQYLPPVVRPYAGVLDRHGVWRHEPTYGYVWYPTTVHVGWRPYHYGRWAMLRPYGWTWIGADPWAWPTHHFGRWGFSAGVWFWIPGRHWGPAWVAWAHAPGFVSWAPLGWHNRPIVQIVNVHVHGRGLNPWHVWTVVPRRHFGTGFVHVGAVRASALDATVRGSFTPRDRGPEIVGHAVPRASAPIRAAGRAPSIAVPRGSAPVMGDAASTAAGHDLRRGSPGARPSSSAVARTDAPDGAGAVVSRPRAVQRMPGGAEPTAAQPAERVRTDGASRRTAPVTIPLPPSPATPEAPAAAQPVRRAVPRGEGAAEAPDRVPAPHRAQPRVRDHGVGGPTAPAAASPTEPSAPAPSRAPVRAVPRGATAPPPEQVTPAPVRRVAPPAAGGQTASPESRPAPYQAAPGFYDSRSRRSPAAAAPPTPSPAPGVPVRPQSRAVPRGERMAPPPAPSAPPPSAVQSAPAAGAQRSPGPGGRSRPAAAAPSTGSGEATPPGRAVPRGGGERPASGDTPRRGRPRG